jgi:hypothetical protein
MSDQTEPSAVPAVNKSAAKWIAPLCVSLVSFAAFFATTHVSPEFNERNVEWLQGAYIAAGIIFLWSTIRLVLVLTKSERRGQLLILTGFGIITIAWFGAQSFPGIVVGGIVVITGLFLLVRQPSGKTS